MDNSAQGTTGTLTRSVVWNYFGYFAELAAGILLLAYVVRHVSVADYGLLLLAQALGALLYTVDFGLSNVSIQLFAAKLSQNGMAEVGRAASTLSTALLAAGAAAALVLNGVAYFVPHLLQLPSQQSLLALRVLVIVSIAVALDVASGPIEHLCQTFHLFDRTTQVRIALVLLRVVLTVFVLRSGFGIIGLAVVQGVLSFSRLVTLWVVAPSCIGGITLRPFSFDWASLRSAFAMSKWAFGDDVARRLSMSAQPVILAAFASVSQVALFGMAAKLPAHLYTLAARGLDVMLPTLAHSHHQNDQARLRRVYVAAFRLCVTGVLPVAVFAAICARPLLVVWAGTPYAAASLALVWLLASAVSQAIMLPSDIVLYTHGQIPLAAKFSVIETIAKIVLPMCLVFRFGAAGVAAGVALAHWFVHLCFYLPAACRTANIPATELVAKALSRTSILKTSFIVGVLLLVTCIAKLSPVPMFGVCLAVIIIYAALWVSAAVALRRSQPEQQMQRATT